MIDIRQENDAGQKAQICNTILRALPDWFGVEAGIVNYVREVQAQPFWAAYDGEAAVGFIALKAHNPYAAELCVMGVLAQYHRRGIGRELAARCEAHCTAGGFEYLTVKTLDESAECEYYAKTRRFYLAQGFRPLEVFPLHWDEENPCLFMVKRLG